jgi:hypothetical protein
VIEKGEGEVIRKTSKKGGEEANLATRPAKGEANRPTKCSNKWRRTKKEHCIRIVKNLKVSTEERRLENSRKQIDLLTCSTPRKHWYGSSHPYIMTAEIFRTQIVDNFPIPTQTYLFSKFSNQPLG